MKDTAQILTKKILTAPVLNNPCSTFVIGTHDYGNTADAWTLDQAEGLKMIHKPTNASGPVDAIVVSSSIPYVFINA